MRRLSLLGIRLAALFPLLLAGCSLIGPDFDTPESRLGSGWMDQKDPRLKNGETGGYRDWWKAFKDPVLDRLINTAYAQNLSLRAAGIRVLAGRAQLGVAIGDFYPQSQSVEGLIWDIQLPKSGLSERLPGTNRPDSGNNVNSLWLDRLGPTVSWEVDLWGKFRRAIESADASMLAAVADYDSLLVSLTGDVATYYIKIRTLERRLDIARTNVDAQRGNLKIAESKFLGGSSSRRDVEQAKTVLGGTQATIPKLDAQLRISKNALCVLLGIPPQDIEKLLGSGSETSKIPFQALVVQYQNQVLKAQQEVEDGLIFFLKTQDAAEYLAQSTAAAKRSLELATIQYREGMADFTTVLTAEQSLLSQQDTFASTLGDVAIGLVTVYRGMGGGWQIREGHDFIPADIREAMDQRTGWGDLLKPLTVPSGPAQGTVRAPEW
ncbi:MAG: TolC family protein [Gammaproteobacteria bacterium]|nr:TolC family protein [Gammaproteobacteria bacterium]